MGFCSTAIHRWTFVSLAVLAGGLVPDRAVASCWRSECMRKCEADCVKHVVAPEQAESCKRDCGGPTCSQWGSCERILGYRRDPHGGAHLSYGIGGAVLPGGVDRGFRHHLELAGVLGPGKQHLSLGNSITGSMDMIFGPAFGLSGLLGLGSSPSYALVEAGYGTGLLAGAGAFLGAGARLNHGRTAVIGLRVNADLLLVNVGLRTLVSFESSPDLLVCFTVGVGRF